MPIVGSGMSDEKYRVEIGCSGLEHEGKIPLFERPVQDMLQIPLANLSAPEPPPTHRSKNEGDCAVAADTARLITADLIMVVCLI